jgi:hypothetical protein
MHDSEKGGLNQQIKKEEAKTPQCNPVFEALGNILENDQPVCVCQLMSELYNLAEKEQAAEDKKAET